MHNRLIFRYRRERVRANSLLLRGCAGTYGCWCESIHMEAASDGVTQKDR